MSTKLSTGMDILHVLTLDDGAGEYGGPVGVASQICNFTRSQLGLESEVIAGTRLKDPAVKFGSLRRTRVKVYALTNKFPISSLFSLTFAFRLFIKVRQTKLVHIHAGRDLISIYSAWISRLQSKPYFIQTHGMIIQDKRKFVKIIDFFIIKRMLKRAEKVYYLNSTEMHQLQDLFKLSNLHLLENGILTSSEMVIIPDRFRVVFCSRIHPDKNIFLFIRIIDKILEVRNDIDFLIYGPDGGDLPQLLIMLSDKKYSKHVKYLGALRNEEVLNVLRKASCLILPSTYDPFPMIVLECCSVGTPVLISSACGNSQKIAKINELFVSYETDPKFYVQNLLKILPLSQLTEFRLMIQNGCKKEFGLNHVFANLSNDYNLSLR